MATMQKVIKVGSSVAAVLPKTLIKGAGITAGTQISVEPFEGGIFVRSVRRMGTKSLRTADARVAETALGLIKRYQNALKRLADA
jgi:antitoxin component of MazEF toxin-antitoxin module